MENLSEVARLRQRIADEYEAADRALHGPAMVGRHDFIVAHTANMSSLIMELKSLVGDEVMVKMIREL